MNNWIGQTVKHVWNNILACAKLRFGFLHKHNSFPLGPEQPWCPTSKELHVHSQLTCDRLVDDECGKVEPDLANVGRAGTNTYPENQFGAHQSGKWWPLLLRGHQMQEIWHSLNFVKMTHSIFIFVVMTEEIDVINYFSWLVFYFLSPQATDKKISRLSVRVLIHEF